MAGNGVGLPYAPAAAFGMEWTDKNTPIDKRRRPVDDIMARPIHKCRVGCSFGTMYESALPAHEANCKRKAEQFSREGPGGVTKEDVQGIVNASLEGFKTQVLSEIRSLLTPQPKKKGRPPRGSAPRLS